ncbi:Enolase [Astathelohania contejeani]|uniref:phosphopyruvate hydratase n=1 Tax=Astathelohania contejeani TaxID=164912 RepID=A0ABQ7HW28_9MICR|nr:Enolase [Thelohania contejeani]
MKVGELFQTIKTRQILTSRGKPTVEVDLHTTIGVFRSSCPSGASTGSKEAKAIIDKNDKEYMGNSVRKALFHINNIIVPRITDLKDVDIYNQKLIDAFLDDLDGTPNKSRIGANAILPISMSFCRAGAVALDLSAREFISKLSSSQMGMPFPYFNVINGGAHSGNNLVFQEIMISFHTSDYSKNLEFGCVFYEHLKKVIIQRYGSSSTSVGDEGGFAPKIDTLEQALDLIMEAYKVSKLEKMRIAIDAAANEFYENGKYKLGKDDPCTLDGKEMVNYYLSIIEKYPLVHSLEDPFAEDDFDSWILLMKKIEGSKLRVVGDDLTVTNPELVKMAGEKKMCNTLLVKPNQIGTISEALEAIEVARNYGMKIMVSHRSGETEDTFIADFSVGIGSDYAKFGAPCRGERISKYNQLLRINEAIEKKRKKY